MSLQAAQKFYVQESVATASPARLLTLLYDRLARDIGQARSALLADQRDEADRQLEHAGDIITELLTTLDGNIWAGAGDLAPIYAWMMGQLVAARVQADASVLAPVHSMVMELGQAWHLAADSLDTR